MFKNRFLLYFIIIFVFLFIGGTQIFSFSLNPIPLIKSATNSLNRRVSDIIYYLVMQKEYTFNKFSDPNVYPDLEISDAIDQVISLNPNISSDKNTSTNLVNVTTSTLPNIAKTGSKSADQIGIDSVPLVLIKESVTDINETTANANGLQILKYSNLEREKKSLSRLQSNVLLNKIANLRADDLFAKQYFDHNSPDGSTASSIATKIGYDYLLIGENLALGNFSSDSDIVSAWMDSPGHRANILNSKFTELGVAAKEGIFKGNKVLIAVQIFAAPLSNCPRPNQAIKDLIDSSAITINQMQQDALIMFNNLNTIKNSPGIDLSYYNQKVQEYNYYAKKVNDAISIIKDMINNYNNEVLLYNKCLNN